LLRSRSSLMATLALPGSPQSQAPTAGGGAEALIPGVSNVGYAMKKATQFFLVQEHYRQLLGILCEMWNDSHSLSAAIRLMEAHGVPISKEDEEELLKLPEPQRIEKLVNKMPKDSREKFEHFFLQLSFLASTTSRLRSSLEVGAADSVEEALESAENVGVLGHLLKMTIFQAGQEVKKREVQHQKWLKKHNDEMSALLKTSSAAMAVQKDLAQAKSTLEAYHGGAKAKSRSMLMHMSEGKDGAIVGTMFGAWKEHTQKARREKEVKAQYQDRIDEVNRKLFKMREKQLGNVKKVLQKQSRDTMDQLMLKCLAALKAEEQEVQRRKELAKEGEMLMTKMQNFSATAAENAKSFMNHMNRDNESGLLVLGWQAWRQFIDECHKDAELTKSLKEKEQQVSEFMKKRKEGAKSVLTQMTHGCSAAMLQSCYTAWVDLIKDRKQQEKVEEELNAKSAQLSSFQTRNKAAGMSVSEKQSYLQDQGLLIRCWCMWRREARIERIRALGREKDRKRKQELGEVKGMFRTFASDLNSSLLQAQTPRED